MVAAGRWLGNAPVQNFNFLRKTEFRVAFLMAGTRSMRSHLKFDSTGSDLLAISSIEVKRLVTCRIV